jgi:hypothetical protein
MTHCKGCGSEFRSGTLAFLLTPKGLVGARVCPACVKRGVLVVPVLVAPVIEHKTSRATAKELLAPVVKNLEAQLKAMRALPGGRDSADFMNGKIEAIENMLATLKEVRA